MFEKRETYFESALNLAVESCFQDGLEIAMNELNLKELIAKKAKELLSEPSFTEDLAIKKVRSSLGLI